MISEIDARTQYLKIEFERKKLYYGIFYGLVCGFAFVLLAWGIDAWLLMRANNTYSWVKFVTGLVLCVPASGLVGGMTVHYGKHGLSLLFWLLLAVLFSWLVIWLPTDGTAEILRELDPRLFARLNYGDVYNLNQFRAFSIFVIGLAAAICGLLEISLVEQALNSSHASGALMMVVVGVVLFGLAGIASDNLVNDSFREPVQAVNDLIQFAKDHQGEDVPRDIARQKHLSAVSQLSDILNRPRELTLIHYDPYLGQMEILVNFEGTLVQCTTIYGQPTNCNPLTSSID
jgi:sulfite exporter TauE/SafE